MRMSGNHMQQPPPLPSTCLVPKKKKPCKVKGTCTMLLSLEQPAPTRQPVRRRAGQNDRKKKSRYFEPTRRTGERRRGFGRLWARWQSCQVPMALGGVLFVGG
jgi:hypothetical protein